MKCFLFSATAILAAALIGGFVSVDAAPAKSAAAKKKSAAKAAVPAAPKEELLEAEIDINPAELAPCSTIELRFPSPIIAKDKVGSADADPPLVIEPALAGSFEWTSTRSGIFTLSQPPKFNATYKFSLKPGLKDVDGKSYAAGQLDETNSAPFRIIDQYPKWRNDDSTKRMPKLMFEFNDQVNPAEAAKAVYFSAAQENLRIAAKARHATGKDFDGFYAEPQATWAEEVSEVKPAVAGEAARLSALVIEPESPLPVAKKWTLEITNSLKNLSGHDALATGDSITLGEVEPFAVEKITAHTPFDRDYFIRIVFNRSLLAPPDGDDGYEPEALKQIAKKWIAAVRIEPAVEITDADADHRSIELSGKFALGTEYKIRVEPQIESGDGLPLQAAAEAKSSFVPNPPYVAVPSFMNAQLASGSGEFEISAANVRQVRLRAKRLTGAELLEAVEKYQTYEQKFYATEQKRKSIEADMIEDYPGAQIFDRTFPVSKPLDKSELLKIKWSEVLGGAPSGPLFVEVEGTAMDGAGEQDVIAQTLVEFTDLGIMQKTTGRESMVFVVSLKTGKPVPGVRLTMVDGDRKLLGYGDTDANGTAIIRGGDPEFVIAEKGDDVTAIKMGDRDGSIPMWHFGINTAWRSPWEPRQKTFVFSDRPVYKPGETAHFKAFTREALGDDLLLADEPLAGRVTIRDPRYKTVLDKEVTITKNGSWSDDIVLPEGPTGWYGLSLSVDDADNADEDSDNGQSGSVSFRVDEYRPNTFEVHFDSDKLNVQPDRLKLPLRANYFMGKSLSRAKASWSATRTPWFNRPEQYAAFHFGDAPRWANYGQDRDASPRRYYHDEEEEDSWDAYGNAILSDEGMAELEMPVPPADKASLPQRIRVEAEVTDINQQTITSSTEITLPGAEFILGVKGPEYWGTAGKELQLEIVAISPEGKAHGGEVAVNVKIERQSYNTIKIATAGGGSTTKDQVVLQQEFSQTVPVKPAGPGQPASASINFKPARGGAYFITAEAVDPKGKKLLSRLPFYVIGGNEFPWAMEDGAKINLQADKTELRPGEEATIVVKTPIAGTALVTVERNRIHRQFITQIAADNPMIKVPVQDAESPNVFVSVIVIRGADGSPKKHKMPEYKIGYVELTVKSESKNLAVDLKPDRPEVKPGETVNITGIVTDAKKQPVAGSEVTLYAVDEGVLSLMKYQTPDPRKLFHVPFALAIKNWTSFDSVLPEDAAERTRGNKGFLVGGGGEEETPNIDIRKNFVATPLWIATAMSDAAGKIAASVKAPDNLTRYRIMAVAAAGADRFGNGESAFAINKPLMIEPVVPRFARLNDEVLVKAVVHNTTKHSGEIEIELQLDDKASLITEERPFILTSLASPKAVSSGKTEKRTIAIKAGETTSATFPVKFGKLGTAKWKWTARTTNWSDPVAVNDGTESVFEVAHPMPELREVKYVRLDAKTPIDNLIKDFNPQILEGDGSVEVSASASRLSEVRDALGYVLHYPYGCVEQTSSSTMPWLALGGYHDLFPEYLAKDKAKSAIQAGANRLLTMVTDEGGLAYWPGGREPNVWGTAYGGFVLMKCRDAGAAVPQAAIDGMLSYLSKSLRNLDTEKDYYNLTNAALSLYTLAKGGKAEPAYENLLYSKRDQLPEIAKLYLALAMCIHNAPEQQIKELLGWKPKPAVVVKKAEPAKAKSKAKAKAVAQAAAPRPAPAPVWRHWIGDTVNKSLRLIACTHLGLKEDADAIALSLLQSRSGAGEWGNTYTNSWTLLAMAAYERSLKTTGEKLDLRVKWDAQDLALTLPTASSTAKTSFVLNDNLSAKPLTIDVPEGRTAFARVEAKAWLPRTDFAGENKGYGITRAYSKLLPDGATAPIEDLRVGDMVLVTLNVEIGGGDRYLAINDPLPAVFEAINPDFDTQAGEGSRAADGHEPWFCDFRELRTDRALFFTDYAPGKGKFTLSYLVRVIQEGDTIAPPARIEAMYQPDKYGLSPTQRIRTLPSATGKNVAAK